MKKIKTIRLTSLLASASVEFHSVILGILMAFQDFIPQIKSLLERYQDAIKSQQLAGNKNPKLSNTREITEKDKARDLLMNRFFKTVKDFLKSPIEEEKKSAQTVYDEISRFEGTSSYEKNKETGEIKKFLEAVQLPSVWDAIGVLRLDYLIYQITNANSEFDSAMNTRAMGESQKTTLNAAEQRKITESIYLELVEMINALALVSPSEEINECINQINIQIDEYGRTIAHMQKGGSGNESIAKKPDGTDTEDDGTEDPDEGTDETIPEKEE
jgi:hypothetical protein